MTKAAKYPEPIIQLPPMTPLQNVSRSQQDIATHRGQTSALIETILDGYWQTDMSQMKRNLILTDWCDELEDWPVESINTALRQWRRENPNKKPNPGHILQILKRAWGERHAAHAKAVAQRKPPQEPQKNPDRSQRMKAVADLKNEYPGLITIFPSVNG